jgi:hypothetical protein
MRAPARVAREEAQPVRRFLDELSEVLGRSRERDPVHDVDGALARDCVGWLVQQPSRFR